MRRSFVRGCGLFLAALALPVFAVGTATAAKSTTKVTKLKPATLNGSGSSLQLAFDQVVIGDFRKIQPAVTINYASVGSGTGRQNFTDQVVDWAGTDAPYSAADASKPKGGAYLYFPTVADPISVAYNLPSVKKLRLSPDTIAGIFQRQITKWDDPKIAADNPGVKLPSTAITVAHRSDGSGTTENFTIFLKKASPTVWTLGSGATVNWPSDTQGAPQNTGVAQILQKTEGAIGYVDYSDAQAIGLTYAEVKNADGKFVAPSTAGASLAVAGATVNANLTYDPIYAAGPKTYPITSPTYILAYVNQTDVNKGNALVAFLNYIYGPGQKTAPKVDYAPLSKSLLTQAKAQVSKIVIPAA